MHFPLRPLGGDELLDLSHLCRRGGGQIGGDAQQPQHAGPRGSRSDAAGDGGGGGDGGGVESWQTGERQGETLQPLQQEEIDAPSSLSSLLLRCCLGSLLIIINRIVDDGSARSRSVSSFLITLKNNSLS